MYVEMLGVTHRPLDIIYTAGRRCHSVGDIQELMQECEDASFTKKVALLDFLVKSKHLSVLEHVNFTFAIGGVSRTFLAQFSRHRIGISLSVQSQRYVSMEDIPVVVPPKIAYNKKALTIYDDALQLSKDAYVRLRELGVAAEDARFIVPEATATELITTINLRALIHLYETRVLVKGAQWEIRDAVKWMVAVVCDNFAYLEVCFPNFNKLIAQDENTLKGGFTVGESN